MYVYKLRVCYNNNYKSMPTNVTSLIILQYYEFYVEMSPNCSILASIFKIFPGGMPPDPPSSSMLRMLGSVLHTSLPKRLVP